VAKLTLTHPLSDREPLVLREVAARVRPQAKILELRGDGAVLAKDFPHVLPDEPNSSREYAGWRALWLRPDGWLLTVAGDGHTLEHPFGSGAAQKLCRLTDVSHAMVCIALSGSAARVLLAKGTPLDLRPDRFGAGQCARTWCAGFTVLLDCHHTSIDIYVDTSFAVAFWQWIGDAAEEFRSQGIDLRGSAWATSD
jgi:heterotetrameric sarcosine oxidase gamma subunit